MSVGGGGYRRGGVACVHFEIGKDKGGLGYVVLFVDFVDGFGNLREATGTGVDEKHLSVCGVSSCTDNGFGNVAYYSDCFRAGQLLATAFKMMRALTLLQHPPLSSFQTPNPEVRDSGHVLLQRH